LIFAVFGLSDKCIRAQSDPALLQTAQFTSSSISVRETAFYAFLALRSESTFVNRNYSVGIELANVLKTYPADQEAITTSLIGLLNTENEFIGSASGQTSPNLTQAYGDYYSDLVAAVSQLNDPRNIPSLLPVIVTGDMAMNALAAYGPLALDNILDLLYNQDENIQDAAIFTLLRMLEPANASKVGDETSRSKIFAGLSHFLSKSSDSFMKDQAQTGLDQLPPEAPADINGDGVVNCADLNIVKTAFGKKVGQSGFDIRADVNSDGVVSVIDLSMVAKQLPAGTVCK
jgi:hypothetical protein